MSEKGLPGMTIIVAMTKDRVIGEDNRIPWYIPEDLKAFKRITSGGVVIMGRRTFESIGRPLPNRHNLVVSKTLVSIEGAEVFGRLEDAVERAAQFHKKIFFIGGREIYKKALDIAEYMYISWVKGSYTGNILFPDFNQGNWVEIETEEHEEFCLKTYKRKSP